MLINLVALLCNAVQVLRSPWGVSFLCKKNACVYFLETGRYGYHVKGGRVDCPHILG